MKKPNPMQSLCRSLLASGGMQTNPHVQTRRFGQRVFSSAPVLPLLLALTVLAAPVIAQVNFPVPHRIPVDGIMLFGHLTHSSGPLDILGADDGGPFPHVQLRVYPNDGAGSVSGIPSDTWSPPGGAVASKQTALADLNGDGFDDVIVVLDEGIYVYLNDGTGRFSNHGPAAFTRNNGYLPPGVPGNTSLGGNFRAAGIVVGKTSPTGNIDVLVTGLEWRNWLLKGNGDGTFQQNPVFVRGFLNAATAKFADVEGNGFPALVSASGAYLYVFRNNHDGTFGSDGSFNTNPSFYIEGFTYDAQGNVTGNNSNFALNCALIDMDRDGKLDLVLSTAEPGSNGTGWTGYLKVFKNLGAAQFSTTPTIAHTELPRPQAYNPGSGAWYNTDTFYLTINAADVDGDGQVDLLASAGQLGQPTVLRNKGDGTFSVAWLSSLTDINNLDQNQFPGTAGNVAFGLRLDFVDFNANGQKVLFASNYRNNSFQQQTPWGENYGPILATTPPATPPVIFTRTSQAAEPWKKYTATFIPTHSGNYTLGFKLTALGASSTDASILIDAVQITTGTTTVFTNGFETPVLASNSGVSSEGGTAPFGSWMCINFSGILNGSPPNWGLAAQGLGSADGTVQYAYLQAVSGTLGKIRTANSTALAAGQTYTVSFYQASRRDFGGEVTYSVTIDEAPGDTTAPVITAPANITAEATGPSGAAVTFTATANDNVDGSVSVTANPPSGSTFPIGTTTVNLSARDAANNTASASFTITVYDSTAPALTVPVSQMVEATSAAGAVATFVATATDAVGVTSLTYSAGSGSIFPVGTTTVTVTAQDAAGNSSSRSFTVTVRDTAPPVITAPANRIVEATGPSGAVVTFTATAQDNVDGPVNVTASPASGSTFPLGTNSVSLSARDAANNTATASFTVTVRDTTPPVITPTANLSTPATSAAGAVVTFAPVATDAVSAVTVATSPASGSTFPVGTTVVTVTATDAANNTATSTFSVTVAKATATVILGNLAQIYNGTARMATATTVPAGLNVNFTYDGSPTAPIDAGDYAVVGTVNDANYTGSASGTLTIGTALATVTLASLTQTYDGTPKAATATSMPAGLPIRLIYNNSETQPTNAGSYPVIGVIDHPNYFGQASGTLTIAKATAIVTLGSLSHTYDGTAKSASVTTAPAGFLAFVTTYNGSGEQPTAAGSYAVLGTVIDLNYTGSASGTLTIAKAAASVFLGSLTQTYDGTAKPASAATSPSGLSVSFTYNGSPTSPTAPGTYAVVGTTVNNPNYITASASGTLTIAKATATVTLGSLSHIYDGTAKSASATTFPANLPVSFTYNGSATHPTAVGSYAIVGTINHANFTGSASGTMTIAKATASVTLGSLTHTYNGTAKSASATTVPAGLPVSFTYNGSATGPLNAGSYTVVGTINHTNYTGSASGTLTIAKAAATVTLGSLTQDFDGTPKSVTATTVPAGLTINFTYNGAPESPTYPRDSGSYSVVGSVNELNYTGSASDTLRIAIPASGSGAVAWGNNESGQTTVPTGLSGLKAIAAGLSHTVALKSDGTVVAWGDNSAGQTTVPAGLTGVTAIAAGNSNTVALKSDGTVVAWGFKSDTVPAGLSNVKAIAAGAYHVVALKSDKTVVAWGDNSSGQARVPAGLSGVVAISAGAYHTVVLKSDNNLIAWGDNTFRQGKLPVGVFGTTAIAAGGYHTVVLRFTGKVYAFGGDFFEQSTVPADLTGVTAIAAGGYHTVALKSDGTVVAWGDYYYGQTTVPTGLTGVTAIAAGVDHTVALVPPPILGPIIPAERLGGTGGFDLNLQGSGFTGFSVVRWNNTTLNSTFVNGSSLVAQVPASLVPVPANGIMTALITVVNPGGIASVSQPLTIKAPNVGPVQSKVAAAGQSVKTPLPQPPVGPTLAANFVNKSGGPASVTTATYTSNPIAGTRIDIGGGIVDLQISGADASDSATVQFYYAPAITGAAEAALVLRYWNGAAWVSIRGSGGATPVKNTANNLEGTVSGGRFTVLFDNTSTPKITELSGTVIAMSINEAPAVQADAGTVAAGAVLAIGAPGVLGNDTDREADPLEAVLISEASHGQVALQPDGSFVYTPEANYTGPDSFSYLAHDGNAESEVTTVAITVTPANAPPVIPNHTAPYGAPFSYTIPPNAFGDAGTSQTVSYSAAGLPPGITLNAATRTLSGTPRAAGVFLAQVTASDNAALPPWSATASFTFTVARVPLVVTANNAARDYGQVSPPLSGTVVGVVNNDNIQVTYSTSATKDSPVGSYPIVPSLTDLERKLGNYLVTQNSGTFTVRAIPPVANAGPDQIVEATDLSGANVTLIGRAATDPGNIIVSYQWSEGAAQIGSGESISVTRSLGVHIVKLTVTDVRGLSSSDTLSITVRDTEPPSLTVPAPIVVSAAPGHCDAAISFTVTASDASSVTIVSTPASGSTFPIGTNTVTSVATDASGNKATNTFTITVKENVELGNAVVVARNSVWLKQKAEIHSGDVIANANMGGPYLNEGVELSIGQDVTTPAGFALRANRISIRQKATINSDLYFNGLDNRDKSSTNGVAHSPLPLPVFCSLPPFETAPAGTNDITPTQGQTVTLTAGSYRDVVLKQKSTLILNGGTYNLRNLEVGQDTKVLFKAASIVRIAEKFSLDQKSILGPDTGSGIGAKDIVLYVNGINGNNGNLNANPDAAKIGQDCTVQANFYVPNGTLSILQKATATGAFLARDVMVAENAELTLASRFGPAGGAALASLPSRAVGGQLVVPLVTRVQRTADGAMDLLFNGNPGSAYSLQTSQDLKTWENLVEVQAGPDGAIQFTDSAASELRQRFYRVIPMQPASGGGFNR